MELTKVDFGAEFFLDEKHLYERLRGKKIIVFGACGLVSSTLIDLLVKADEELNLELQVTAVARNEDKIKQRFSAYLDNKKFCYTVGDVVNFQMVEDYDFVIHAASPAHPQAYAKTPVEVMEANFIGTWNLLKQCKKTGTRFVFISSTEVLGENRGEKQFRSEDDYGDINILSPRACYPESKRSAETLCVSFGKEYGVDFVIIRPCQVFGPFVTEQNSRADAQFLRNAISHEDILMKSSGAQLRSMCYVNDAALAVLYASIYGISGEAYNMADNKNIATLKEYAMMMAEVCSVKVVQEEASSLEKEGYSKIKTAVFDGLKLQKLGWRPRFSIREGIEDMIKYYQ